MIFQNFYLNSIFLFEDLRNFITFCNNVFSDSFSMEISSVDPKYQIKLCNFLTDQFTASHKATRTEEF